jgi:hypothetical protein
MASTCVLGCFSRNRVTLFFCFFFLGELLLSLHCKHLIGFAAFRKVFVPLLEFGTSVSFPQLRKATRDQQKQKKKDHAAMIFGEDVAICMCSATHRLYKKKAKV